MDVMYHVPSIIWYVMQYVKINKSFTTHALLKIQTQLVKFH